MDIVEVLCNALRCITESNTAQTDIPLDKLDLSRLNEPWCPPELTSYIENFFSTMDQYITIEDDSTVISAQLSANFVVNGADETAEETPGTFLDLFDDGAVSLSSRSDRVVYRTYRGGCFVIKREHDVIGEEKFMLRKNLFYEYFVGKMLNVMRKLNPFFSYTFAYGTIHHPCEGNQSFLFRQYAHGISFMNMLRDRHFKNLEEPWHLICLTKRIIEQAYSEVGFLHQNLHLFNIILVPLLYDEYRDDENSTRPDNGYYEIKFENPKQVFKVRYAPFIVDLNNAQIACKEKVFNRLKESIWPDMVQMMWGFCSRTNNIHYFREVNMAIHPRLTHDKVGELINDAQAIEIFKRLNARFGKWNAEARLGPSLGPFTSPK